MNDHLEERLERMFGRRADSAGQGEALVRGASTRGQRLIRRRRITAGLAFAAIAAVAVPVGVNNLGAGERTIVPADTSAARPSLPAKPVTVTIDLEKLPEGAPPRVPYYSSADTAIHDGDRTIPVDAYPGGPVYFAPVEGGYVVQVEDTPEHAVLVDSSGDKIRNLPVMNKQVPFALLPAISTDGSRLAWMEYKGDSGKGTMVVADASTGDVVGEKRFDKPFVWPVGFAGDGVVVTDDSGSGDFSKLWNPETGKVSDLEGVEEPFATDGSRRLVTQGDPTVFDVITNERLWEVGNGDLFAGSMTKDGRYLLLNKTRGDWSADTVLAFDAETGRKLLEVRSRSAVDHAVSEPNGDLLVPIYEDSKSALVRCSIDGSCERATAISDPSEDDYKLPTHR